MNSPDQNTTPSSTKIQVADNVCYTLVYRTTTNRLYLTLKGFWKNEECVPQYLQDLQKALALTKPRFTILTDLRNMITHPQEMKALHEQSHLLVMKAGVYHVAHVVSQDKIANLQTSSIIQSSGLPVTNFSSITEAEAWLNVLK